MEDKCTNSEVKSTNDIVSQCTGCTHNLTQFLYICSDPTRAYEFLIDHGIIRKEVACYRCGKILAIDFDRLQFRCNHSWKVKKKKKRINKSYSRSITAGTWLQHDKLGIEKTCRLMYMWLVLPSPRVEILKNELQASFISIVKKTKSFRQVCEAWLALSRVSQPLGGVGHTVEIDQQNVTASKDKPDSWVIGGCHQSSDACFFECIYDLSCELAQRVVRDRILPGTTLLVGIKHRHLYKDLEKEGYVIFIKRLKDCVDPVTGKEMGKMQSLWNDLHTCIPTAGRSRENLSGYIAEFMFKRKYPSHIHRTHAFLSIVAEVYPPE